MLPIEVGSLLAWANDHGYPTVSSEPEVTKLCLLLVFELVETQKNILKKIKTVLGWLGDVGCLVLKEVMPKAPPLEG